MSYDLSTNKMQQDSGSYIMNDTPQHTHEFKTNFIVFTEGDAFKWAICDFISNDKVGDNTADIDNKIIALRDDDGAISKKQLDLLINEYWEKLPQDVKDSHKNHKTIRASSSDANAYTALIDFAGSEDDALHLLHEHGFDVIDTDSPNNDYTDEACSL